VALALGAATVRCNSVHPGMVATPMTEGLERAQRHVALGRLGEPMELSHLIVFLASDESSFCTGAEFVADGGETAGLAPGAMGEGATAGAAAAGQA
jgi:3alpha(or 20beta)-hydroxysteroid dehydrogenase